MAVYTEVPKGRAQALFAHLQLGPVLHLEGIQGGIENTNYFVTTPRGEWVLTLFERLNAQQLPFYLHLMKHLAGKGIPVPDPQADPPHRARSEKDELVHELCGKPAAVVNRLQGRSELRPGIAHCECVGRMLARAHLATRDFEWQQPNLRGLPWWNETAPTVLPHLDAEQARMLRDELARQNALVKRSSWAALPRSAVHADLFRDNVMFTGSFDEPVLTGFFDYYFAGVDSWLFDLCVALNDWCIDLGSGEADEPRSEAMLQAYQAVRPLSDAEQELLPDMLRAGALRFWISRLWDFYKPRPATLLIPHDPAHFERVLKARRQEPAWL